MEVAKKVIFFSLLTLSVVNAFAQKVHITGVVITDSARPLEDCYIKVSSVKDRKILAYLNTGARNTFSFYIRPDKADSITISASHVGYRTSAVPLFPGVDTLIYSRIILSQQNDTLSKAMVDAPAVWVRGDTTFLSAAAFKEGDEKKLVDLLLKMPGFEIDKNGNLLYRKQLVEKIMVEGDDVFADKIKMMLHNFPVHVIKNVQVLKNQNNNPLKKGLVNENKVFLNLSLNKENLSTAFGSGEAGIGTGPRYFFNPVIFSLYGKYKIGYIGNWNNTAYGIDWKQQDELQKNKTLLAENWMMSLSQPQLVNDLQSRQYIKNGQSDNNFTVKIPVSRDIKTTLEVNYFTDKQQQSIYNNSSLYDGVSFIGQLDTSRISYRPSLLTARYKIEYAIDSARQLISVLSFYHNGGQSSVQATYLQQSTLSRTANSMNNNWNSFEISEDYSHRLSPGVLESWKADFSQHFYPQSAQATSAAWHAIFQLPDSSYSVMDQRLYNRSTSMMAGWEKIAKLRTGTLSSSVTYNGIFSMVDNNTSFGKQGNNQGELPYPAISGAGTYNVNAIVADAQRTFNILRIPSNLEAQFGLSAADVRENSSIRHSTIPVYKLLFSTKKTLDDRFIQQTTVSFNQSQVAPYQMYGMLLPTTISGFHKYLNTTVPLRSLNATYLLSWNLVRRVVMAATLNYGRDYSSFTQIAALQEFVQFTYDSVITRGLNRYSASLTTNFNDGRGSQIFGLSFGANVNQALIQSGLTLYPTNYSVYWVAANVRRKIGALYFINLAGSFNETRQTYPPALQRQIADNVSNLHCGLEQRMIWHKTYSFRFTTDYYNNDLLTSHEQSTLLFNAAIDIPLKNKPVSFSIRCENISDRKYYRSFDSGPLTQRFFTVPLIGRNEFISVRYEL